MSGIWTGSIARIRAVAPLIKWAHCSIHREALAIIGLRVSEKRNSGWCSKNHQLYQSKTKSSMTIRCCVMRCAVNTESFYFSLWSLVTFQRWSVIKTVWTSWWTQGSSHRRKLWWQICQFLLKLCDPWKLVEAVGLLGRYFLKTNEVKIDETTAETMQVQDHLKSLASNLR